jgi:hypothetical protein
MSCRHSINKLLKRQLIPSWALQTIKKRVPCSPGADPEDPDRMSPASWEEMVEPAQEYLQVGWPLRLL